MFGGTEDEELFPSNASSNLANLFSGSSLGIVQTDLKYTAPRQPKLMESGSSNVKHNGDETQKVSVVFAKVVIASKLINNTFQVIGKLGFALLGTSNSVTEFLLYRDKQNIIVKVPVSQNFSLRENEGGFEFSNDPSYTWNVKFVNAQDSDEFVRELSQRNLKISPAHEEKTKPPIPNKVVHKKEGAEDVSTEDAQIRADILNRMARMGQSVLPIPTTNEAARETEKDLSEDDRRCQKSPGPIEKGINPIIKEEPKPIAVPYQKTYQISPQIQPYATTDESTLRYPPYGSYETIIQSPSLSQTIQNQNLLQMFVSENRTHNSEIRINLSTISNKIDTVLTEMSKLKLNPNTDRLENEFLKAKICDLEAELKLKSSDDSKVRDLTEKLLEKNSLLRKKEDEIDQMDSVNKNLQLELNDLQNKLKFSSDELSSAQKFVEIQRNEIEDLRMQLSEIMAKYKEKESSYLELEGLHENLMMENKNLHDLNTKLSEDLNTKVSDDLNTKLSDNLNKENNKENVVDVNAVKDVMNEMYQNILGDFEESASVSFKEIKNVLSKHMKQATFNVIGTLQKSLK